MKLLQQTMVAQAALLLVALCSPLALAYNGAEATPNEINDAIKLCKQDAIEADIDKQDLKQFLTDCLNDELEANDFKTISPEKVSKLIKEHM